MMFEPALLTEQQVRDVFGLHSTRQRSFTGRVKAFTPQLNLSCSKYGINTPVRLAAFLAQIGHESGSLAHLKEIWGPTDQQRRYEPPSNLAARLGNNTPGDGFRFRGRGLIQITGRSNYEQVGAGLGVDLIRQPELLEQPDYAVASACWWWQSRGLNQIADANSLAAFERITRIINGGMNGQPDRVRRWELAKKIILP